MANGKQILFALKVRPATVRIGMRLAVAVTTAKYQVECGPIGAHAGRLRAERIAGLIDNLYHAAAAAVDVVLNSAWSLPLVSGNMDLTSVDFSNTHAVDRIASGVDDLDEDVVVAAGAALGVLANWSEAELS